MTISKVLESNPDVLGGALVFKGTRVPAQTLFDYLKQGDSIEEFLEGFPTVSKEQILQLLEEAKENLLEVTKYSAG